MSYELFFSRMMRERSENFSSKYQSFFFFFFLCFCSINVYLTFIIFVILEGLVTVYLLKMTVQTIVMTCLKILIQLQQIESIQITIERLACNLVIYYLFFFFVTSFHLSHLYFFFLFSSIN